MFMIKSYNLCLGPREQDPFRIQVPLTLYSKMRPNNYSQLLDQLINKYGGMLWPLFYATTLFILLSTSFAPVKAEVINIRAVGSKGPLAPCWTCPWQKLDQYGGVKLLRTYPELALHLLKDESYHPNIQKLASKTRKELLHFDLKKLYELCPMEVGPDQHRAFWAKGVYGIGQSNASRPQGTSGYLVVMPENSKVNDRFDLMDIEQDGEFSLVYLLGIGTNSSKEFLFHPSFATQLWPFPYKQWRSLIFNWQEEWVKVERKHVHSIDIWSLFSADFPSFTAELKKFFEATLINEREASGEEKHEVIFSVIKDNKNTSKFNQPIQWRDEWPLLARYLEKLGRVVRWQTNIYLSGVDRPLIWFETDSEKLFFKFGWHKWHGPLVDFFAGKRDQLNLKGVVGNQGQIAVQGVRIEIKDWKMNWELNASKEKLSMGLTIDSMPDFSIHSNAFTFVPVMVARMLGLNSDVNLFFQQLGEGRNLRPQHNLLGVDGPKIFWQGTIGERGKKTWFETELRTKFTATLFLKMGLEVLTFRIIPNELQMEEIKKFLTRPYQALLEDITILEGHQSKGG